MEYKLAVLPGDGVGPEIMDATIGVLDAVAQRYNHKFEYEHLLIGGASIDVNGIPLTEETIEKCKKCDSVLLGAVGGPKWENLKPQFRPERGLLSIRTSLGLYANLRPIVLYDDLKDASPLKKDVLKSGIDIMFVRELQGGIYYGARGYRDGEHGQEAFDTEVYSIMEIERIAKLAFDLAMSRRKVLTSVDKANVLESSRLWRATVDKVAKAYPEVKVNHLYVDNCAMQLVINPSQFDVILTSNMFGDILTDEASVLTGSIGMLPSSSVGATRCNLYEPIHGSAPDIAGQNIANPIATILAAAMMLSTSFRLTTETAAIESAVRRVIKHGSRTKDIANGKRHISCSEMGERIAIEILTS